MSVAAFPAPARGLPHREPAVELTSRSVVLVTGGAQGITAEVVREFARRTGATFILLGRSELPGSVESAETAPFDDAVALRGVVARRMRAAGDLVSPRDVERHVRKLLTDRSIRRTLADLRRAGSAAEYVKCDVRVPELLTEVVRSVEQRYGGIDAVIHGAGVIEDKYIVEKSEASIERVIGTKVDPVLCLARILDPERLKLFMIFSSVAGFFGNPGQGDYAAGSEILNSMGRRLRALWSGRVVAFNWGPWSGAGMVTPEVGRQFESRGIGLIPVADGCLAAWNELLFPAERDVRVIIGDGPWVKEGDSPLPVVRERKSG